jgi:hypothetical protein
MWPIWESDAWRVLSQLPLQRTYSNANCCGVRSRSIERVWCQRGVRARRGSYPALNPLFVAGTGPSVPAEYQVPGHLAEEIIRDIATWIVASR